MTFYLARLFVLTKRWTPLLNHHVGSRSSAVADVLRGVAGRQLAHAATERRRVQVRGICSQVPGAWWNYPVLNEEDTLDLSIVDGLHHHLMTAVGPGVAFLFDVARERVTMTQRGGTWPCYYNYHGQ